MQVTRIKRFMATLLAMVMVMGMMPTSAFAIDGGEPSNVTITVTPEDSKQTVDSSETQETQVNSQDAGEVPPLEVTTSPIDEGQSTPVTPDGDVPTVLPVFPDGEATTPPTTDTEVDDSEEDLNTPPTTPDGDTPTVLPVFPDGEATTPPTTDTEVDNSEEDLATPPTTPEGDVPTILPAVMNRIPNGQHNANDFNFSDFADQIKVKIECECDDDDDCTCGTNHGERHYTLNQGKYKILDEEYDDDDDEITVKVLVYLKDFINLYNSDVGVAHGPEDYLEEHPNSGDSWKDINYDESKYHDDEDYEDIWEIEEIEFKKNHNGKWELDDDDDFEFEVICSGEAEKTDIKDYHFFCNDKLKSFLIQKDFYEGKSVLGENFTEEMLTYTLENISQAKIIGFDIFAGNKEDKAYTFNDEGNFHSVRIDAQPEEITKIVVRINNIPNTDKNGKEFVLRFNGDMLDTFVDISDEKHNKECPINAHSYGKCTCIDLCINDYNPPEPEPIYVSFTINKVDSQDKNILLSGAEFTIYSDEKCTTVVTTVITDEYGKATVEKLEAGKTYYMKETKSPNGYKASETVYTIKTDADKNDKSLIGKILEFLFGDKCADNFKDGVLTVENTKIEGYAVTIIADEGVGSNTGAGTYNKGDNATVTFTLKDGYNLDQVFDNVNNEYKDITKDLTEKEGVYSYTINGIQTNHEIQIKTTKIPSATDVTYTVNHTYYLVTDDGEPVKDDFYSKSVNMTGADGQEINANDFIDTIDGQFGVVSNSGNIVLKKDTPQSIDIIYKRYQYTVAVSVDEGVLSHTDTKTYDKGTDVTVEFGLNDGYKISQVLIDNVDVTSQVVDNKISINDLQAYHNVEIKTEKVSYKLHIQYEFTDGTTHEGFDNYTSTTFYKAGESYEITAPTAPAGYKLVDACREDLTGTFGTADKTVVIKYERETGSTTSTSYTVKHEYYANNSLEYTDTKTLTGNVGNTVLVDDSIKQVTYNGTTYNFTSASPSELVLVADVANNVITLRYDRTYSTGGGGSSGGGGGGTTTPPTDPDDGTDIDEPDVPLVENPDGETDIDEPDVPLVENPDGETDGQNPDVEIPEEKTPLIEVPQVTETNAEETDIADDDVALANLPQTGLVANEVNPYITLGMILVTIILLSAGFVYIMPRKYNDD